MLWGHLFRVLFLVADPSGTCSADGVLTACVGLILGDLQEPWQSELYVPMHSHRPINTPLFTRRQGLGPGDRHS